MPWLHASTAERPSGTAGATCDGGGSGAIPGGPVDVGPHQIGGQMWPVSSERHMSHLSPQKGGHLDLKKQDYQFQTKEQDQNYIESE